MPHRHTTYRIAKLEFWYLPPKPKDRKQLKNYRQYNPKEAMASTVSDDSNSTQAQSFYRLVDLFITVGKYNKPMTALKSELIRAVFAADHCVWWLDNPEVKLCTLDKEGPSIVPEDLGVTWTEAKKYIKVNGRALDREPYLDLFRRPGFYSPDVDLHLTLCLESDVEITNRVLREINLDVAKKYFPPHLELRPASTDEVGAKLDE